MRAVQLLPGEGAKVVDVENNLDALQKMVGGYIECINLGKSVAIVDEEGLMKQLPFNLNLRGHTIVGPMLIVGQSDDLADFKDIENDELSKWMDALR